MAVNFGALLQKPMDAVKRPTAKPPGTYFAKIKDYKFDESKKQKTPYVRFALTNVTAGPDVDASMLVDAEGAPIDLSKWSPNKDYYLTDEALYRLKDLIESLDINTKGRQFSEVLPELKGLPVQIVVTQRPSDDGTEMYNDIGEMSGVKSA
jgi:hypothetical protein